MSAEQEARLDRICDRFEDAWKAGVRPRLEDYLADVPEAERVVAAMELVRVEAFYRRRAGEEPQPADYQARLSLTAQQISKAITPEAPTTQAVTRPASQSGSDPMPGRARMHRPVVPGYEIVGLLGRGGMGVVYRAVDTQLGRPVALKFLRPEFSRDAEALDRFRREARTASSLNHPNIGTVYALDEHEGLPYLAMELVEGQTLRALSAQPVPLSDLVPLIQQVSRALVVAHAAGIVHRDIKPDNVMVRPDGLVKVLDFGLARLLPASTAQDVTDLSPLSVPGRLVGTVHYMAPEQALRAPVGSATDIFSLGLVLYELATGQHPFRAESEISMLHAIAEEEPVPATRLNPQVPAPLEALIRQMLAKDPSLRPSAAEVEATLTQLTAHVRGEGGRPLAGRQNRPTVGRQRERADLRAGLDEAAAGRGMLLCVTGEPGLGKTTFVESFLEELAASPTWSIASGRCSERLAGTEAYLPFLEALDSLLHGKSGAAAAQMMKLLAPTWYVQLVPQAADDPSLDRVLADAKEASQERRKRELAVFLHELSRQRPLVMFLDDLHWADPSSVDLLAYLGCKCAAWRLLLVLTYRPSDLLRSQHPFGPVKLELQGRGVCHEITLPFLSQDDVDRYLSLAFAGHRFPEDLAAVLHARTEGNPLFMVDLLRYLRDRGVIVQDQGRWALIRAMPDLQSELPQSVRGMIQRKVDQLSTADRHLLMAASVQGPEFDSAVVAQLVGREAAEVEERLAVLERVHFMVRLIREQTFPDRTLTLRYVFVHVLYQNSLYAALPPTRKAAWSAAAARALLGHHGEKSAALAAELAILFETARDHQSAADHYLVAAGNAARIFAHHEAVALARRGIAQLQMLPESPDRARREIPLQVTLGVQLQVVHGYAAPEAERTYARARALCEQVQETPSHFLVLWGLWMYYEVGSHLQKSRELAEQLYALAQRDQESAHVLQAHMALAVASFSVGDPAATREHTEKAVAVYDSKRHGNHTHLYGQDPKATSLAFGAVALWLLGYPDQARQRSHEAVALSRELGHPTSSGLALYFASILQQYLREVPAVHEYAEATMAIGTEHGLSLWLANGLIMSGWALAEQGAYADGIARVRQGLTAWMDTGAETHRTYFLGLLAESLDRGGQVEEGLGVLAEALEQVRGSGTVFHEAELHRLHGEFLLRREATNGAHREAEACFGRALTIARRQQARSLELRAAISLTHLCQAQNRPAEARQALADCYGWFSEGFDTPDLRQAKALLEQIP
jgi:predicted ATPase